MLSCVINELKAHAKFCAPWNLCQGTLFDCEAPLFTRAALQLQARATRKQNILWGLAWKTQGTVTSKTSKELSSK